MKTKHILLILSLLAIFSCKQKPHKDYETTPEKIKLSEERTDVDVMILKKGNFYKELISNGKLSAKRKTNLHFETSGRIAEINTKNGNFVNHGGLIARLDDKEALNNFEKAKLNLKRAEIALDQLIIAQGYSPQQKDSIPADILKIAKISSGYASAEIDLQNARNNLQKLELRAPFAGIVANIKKHIYENISPAEDFCTLIDDSQFYVDFKILENEIDLVKVGDDVVVTPFSLKKAFYGKITEINPVVDENGMISVKAEINNQGHLLMDGMNANVRIRKAVPNSLVVPKQAVVIRDGHPVLFRYTHGIAYWTYLKILDENNDSYRVIADPDRDASLNPGDTIIITNNLNLAHKSPVKINRIIKNNS